jgi:membrane protein
VTGRISRRSDRLRAGDNEAQSEKARALGRHARSPQQVPARGWWQVLKRVWAESMADNLGVMAAGCAFYGLLALFPALSILVSVYALVADPTTAEQQLQAIQSVLPDAAYTMIAGRVHELAALPSAGVSWRILVGLVIALWSAANGTKALMSTLNVAYEEDEKRSFVQFNLTAFAFTIGGIIAVMVGLAVILVVPAVVGLLSLGFATAILIQAISFAIVIVFLMGSLALVYRLGPSRREAKWRWISPGSIAASVVWVAASIGFSFYASNFGSYNVTYGSLGAVIVVLLWLWISAYVVLFGAELNAELELQTARDTTAGPDAPMGQRGAFVANHVAEHRDH